MTFGQKIKDLRKEQGLTQEQLAEKLHVTRQAVSNWENDKNYPDLTVLLELAKSFSLSLDDLLLGGKEMSKLTQKLVKDGNEGRHLQMHLIVTLSAVFLMLLGLVCLVIKANSVEYIDEQGFLHENFYLLPLAFIFLFTGSLTALASALRFLKARKN